MLIARRPATHRIVLDETPLAQVRDWLHYRAEQWPNSRNPHVLITDQTAAGAAPMSRYGTGFRRVGITPRQLRQDRILDEATYTADPVILISVFGIGVTTPMRLPSPGSPRPLPQHNYSANNYASLGPIIPTSTRPSAISCTGKTKAAAEHGDGSTTQLRRSGTSGPTEMLHATEPPGSAATPACASGGIGLGVRVGVRMVARQPDWALRRIVGVAVVDVVSMSTKGIACRIFTELDSSGTVAALKSIAEQTITWQLS